MRRILCLIPLLLAGAAPAALPDVVDAAFRDMQMVTGSRTALALSRSAIRMAADDPALAQLVAERQQAAQDAARTEETRIRLATATPQDRTAIETAAQAVTDARARFSAADAALAERSPAFAQLTSIAPLNAREAQALLAPGEAIVMLHSTRDATYIFALTPDKIVWKRAAMGRAAVLAETQALRTALDRGASFTPQQGSGLRGFDYPRKRAFALYTALWGPVEPEIRDAKTVYIIADGPMGAFPFAALPMARPSGRDNDPAALRKTRWLVRAHALVTLPSVGSLRALRSGAHGAAATDIFRGFGDPALDGETDTPAPRSFAMPATNSGGDLRSLIKGFPRLPGTRDELLKLANALGSGTESIVTGTAATEAAVKHAPLTRTSVIAFATHGLLAGEISPFAEPALVLTPPDAASADEDGLLTATEAAALHLGADWIILSACNTAASDGTASNEGLSGLARGFFSAGARALLVSNWRVRDDVAADLTVGTISRWRAVPSAGRAEALRAAMIAMIDDTTHPERASPALWAPFVLAGDGR